jgi:carbon monoxide dehydrogenase subunit G
VLNSPRPPRPFFITGYNRQWGAKERAMHFEGDKPIPLPPDKLFHRLDDIRFLAQCVPGVEAVKSVEERRLECVLRPGFAFVRGTLDLVLEIAELEPGNVIRLHLNTKGIGSNSHVEAALTVQPHENGSNLHWLVGLKSVGGLLKAVPQGLIRAAAQKVIGDALTALEAKVTSES